MSICCKSNSLSMVVKLFKNTVLLKASMYEPFGNIWKWVVFQLMWRQLSNYPRKALGHWTVAIVIKPGFLLTLNFLRPLRRGGGGRALLHTYKSFKNDVTLHYLKPQATQILSMEFSDLYNLKQQTKFSYLFLFKSLITVWTTKLMW